MPSMRAEALSRLLEDLDAFEIPLNPYYDDVEPRGVIDDHLTGKINALRAFCQDLGWAELVAKIKDMMPLQCNAARKLSCFSRQRGQSQLRQKGVVAILRNRDLRLDLHQLLVHRLQVDFLLGLGEADIA